ncbi:MAG: CopG family transcriptional regulator [Nitrospira sp.]|nr:CopG family transcriptional regulator [Nitrospira sp.]
MRALKKKPLQIYIEPRQEMLLESLARKKGTSKAEIIRLSLDRYLSNLPLEEDPAFGIIGLGKSGKGDLSENHDIYLARYTSHQTKGVRGTPLKKKRR